MTEKKVPLYYILVPKVGAPVPRNTILAYSQAAVVENGIVIRSEKSRSLAPNAQGLFTLNPEDEDFDKCKTAIERHHKVHNKKGQTPAMLGPFEDVGKAFEAMHEARPKTDSELVSVSKAKAEKLEADNQAKAEELVAKDKELAELRARLNKQSAQSKR